MEFVLAEADFEFERGETTRALADCQAQQSRRPDVVRLLPALPWRQAPSFLAGAALTPLTTMEPETFSFVAAESLSAGTPVAAFGLGYVPDLAGPAGTIVPFEDGMPALWDAVTSLLADHDAYHAAARAAPGRLAGHQPEDAAAAFLSATAHCPPPRAAHQGTR